MGVVETVMDDPARSWWPQRLTKVSYSWWATGERLGQIGGGAAVGAGEGSRRDHTSCTLARGHMHAVVFRQWF